MALISDAIRKQFGLNLLGIDVIIDKKTGQYGIIDVNAFPGGFIICFSRSCLYQVNGLIETDIVVSFIPENNAI